MKKIVKRTLISIGVLIGIVIIFMVGYMVMAKSEMKDFNTLPTQKITNNLYSINDSFVNIYTIQTESGYIVFDAGNNLNTIESELEKLEIDPAQVIAVFLTHTDGDHVAALSLFKKARVYLSGEEEKLLTGETHRFLLFGNSIDCDNYNLFEDQEIITIGDISIKCIVVPGHTPGSTCYLVNNKYLFTGDALRLKNGKAGTFNDLFNMDTETQIKSLEKLSMLDSIEYIFTAHHGMSDDFRYAFSNQRNE